MGRIRPAILARHLSQLDRIPATPVEPAARTLVFAPHQDDETLGCGGTIALKRRAGAPVRIVFMGDGSHSHARFIEPQTLSAIREREAIAAAGILGVEEANLDFLRLPEARLREHRAEALERVGRIIEREVPDEIYLPYRKDPHDDHIVTAGVVLEALRDQPRTTRVFEYAIWLWRSWPWVNAQLGFSEWDRKLWRSTAHARFGWRILQEFTHAVDISTVRDVKRAALDQHESQMTRYLPDAGSSWITLGDVSGGALLETLLRPREVFRTSVQGKVAV